MPSDGRGLAVKGPVDSDKPRRICKSRRDTASTTYLNIITPMVIATFTEQSMSHSSFGIKSVQDRIGVLETK